MASLASLKLFNASIAKNSNEIQLLPLSEYDRFLVFISGGKDSCASVLHLLELGVPAHMIELHHHLVDGVSDQFMDWPVTRSYCKAFADALGMRYTESWREGGFRAEMLKEESRSLPVTFIDDYGNQKQVGGIKGKIATRRMFPQVSASLTERWCSGSLKIDVGNSFIRHTPRFQEGKTLVVTGERAEESGARARYAEAQIHSTGASRKYETVKDGDKIVKKPAGVKRMDKRWVDHWRAIHSWSEQEVWDIMKRHGIVPHPSYYLGFGRCSCNKCIFMGNNSLATIREIDPQGFSQVASYEAEFGVTIDRKGRLVGERADAGTAFNYDKDMASVAMSEDMTISIRVPPAQWQLPLGAYGENDGPK